MELFGIKFAPLNVPLERRLQTFAAGTWFITMVFGGPIYMILCIYLILYTKLWWLIILYFFWIHFVDNDICERGGRRVQWTRELSWWKYMKDYFPMTLERAPFVELDSKRNYLFCSFPHGMLSAGGFLTFGSKASGFNDLFPHHRPCPVTIRQHFLFPFHREFILALGACSASAKSINYYLSKPEGGNAVGLVIGGAAESFNCKPGQYKVILKKRKGFIKLALNNGAPLVPMISFGETDLYDQVSNPEGSFLRALQEKIRQRIGFAPAIPIGRGFFQYSFGLVPRRKPINVVGHPLDVPKLDNPTQEQIDDYHERFVKHLSKFFEEQKYHYLKNPEETQLIVQ